MSRNLKIFEQTGKVGGQAVKTMIEEVEQKMADGEHVSAAPDSPAEAGLLNQVKQENNESADRAKK